MEAVLTTNRGKLGLEDPRLLGPTADDHRLAELSFPEALPGDGALEKGCRGGPSPPGRSRRRRRMIQRYSSRPSQLRDELTGFEN